MKNEVAHKPRGRANIEEGGEEELENIRGKEGQ